MAEMTGTVLIVQEGRIHIIDDEGAGHLFVLSPYAGAETEQLQALQRRQARVRVTYVQPPNIVGLVVKRIELIDEETAA